MPLPLRLMYAEVNIVSVMVARLGGTLRIGYNINSEHGNIFVVEVMNILCKIVYDCIYLLNVTFIEKFVLKNQF